MASLAMICLAAALWTPAQAQDRFVVLGSTTTTENSGLLDHLKPRFEAATGIELRVVVAGTGKILRLLINGDLDIALTHDPEGERALVADGYGAWRREVMANDYLIAGPLDDPAKVRGAADARAAFARIAEAEALFYSRGDDSGTHRRELAIWGDPPDGAWRRETGAGMGATLNIAVASGGYLLVDRGTWASFARRDPLVPLFEGGAALINRYALTIPEPARHPHLRTEAAEAFADWLTGDEGQAAIASFRIGDAQIFFPNAADEDAGEDAEDDPDR